ncbi:MAG: BatA domain-containing protein [Bacteroidales bacterium]|nr:BatA domain-containing protein [Bacteroidales bacterium]
MAVGVPIVVHLFSFRRYRKVYFSNVERIEELRDETRRQSQLRQWLLLSARILAIVFLVLAFAQPVIPIRNQQLQAGGTVVSLYVDNSFSMQGLDAEGPLLEQARRKVNEIVMAYKPSDRFQLLTNDMQGSQFRWLNRDEVLMALDDMDVSPHTVMLSEVMRRQHDFLMQAQAANRHAYIISDFQQTTADLSALPVDTAVFSTIVHLEAADMNNLYVDSLQMDAPAYHRGSVVTMRAVIRNAGDVAVEKVPVRLYVNGRQRALGTVDLPADGQAVVPLKYVAEEDGVMDCYVEITDYPLTFDDRLYFSVNVSSQLRVLSIGKENPYLKRLFASDSAVVYHHSDEGNIDFAHLNANDFVILDELSSIPTGLVQALVSFVEDGGSLLVVPGVKADISGYNDLLLRLHAPLLGEWNPQGGRVLSLAREASLYRGVFEGRTNDMELPLVKACYRLNATAASVVEPLISMADGSDYLCATAFALGQVYLVASPLEPVFTDFVQQALFVPTFFNMALYSRPCLRTYYPVSYESFIPLSLSDGVERGQVRLSLADGGYELIPDLRISGGHPSILLHGQLSTPGNYHVVSGSRVVEGLSFNYSRRESDMRFYSRGQTEELLAHKTGYSVVRNSQKSLEQYVHQLSDGIPLWRWCVWGVLLMLLVEILILRWPFVR